jgi:hypothetical protein
VGFDLNLERAGGCPTLQLRREAAGEEWSREVLLRDDDFTEDRERRILCRRCQSPVTSKAELVSIGGSRAHRRTNPNGYEFEFACFLAAPGADRRGVPTTQFSWFAGYAWCLAACRSCDVHLGWHFSGKSPEFYGLIIDRIAAEDRESQGF